MRGGISIRAEVLSPRFAGETLPTWISEIKGHPSILDASAVLQVSEGGKRSLRIAVVNRSETESFKVPIHVASHDGKAVDGEVEVHELWHEDVNAKNGWGKENEVTVQRRRVQWDGEWTFREHSFTLLVVNIE